MTICKENILSSEISDLRAVVELAELELNLDLVESRKDILIDDLSEREIQLTCARRVLNSIDRQDIFKNEQGVSDVELLRSKIDEIHYILDEDSEVVAANGIGYITSEFHKYFDVENESILHEVCEFSVSYRESDEILFAMFTESVYVKEQSDRLANLSNTGFRPLDPNVVEDFHSYVIKKLSLYSIELNQKPDILYSQVSEVLGDSVAEFIDRLKSGLVEAGDSFFRMKEDGSLVSSQYSKHLRKFRNKLGITTLGARVDG